MNNPAKNLKYSYRISKKNSNTVLETDVQKVLKALNADKSWYGAVNSDTLLTPRQMHDLVNSLNDPRETIIVVTDNELHEVNIAGCISRDYPNIGFDKLIELGVISEEKSNKEISVDEPITSEFLMKLLKKDNSLRIQGKYQRMAVENFASNKSRGIWMKNPIGTVFELMPSKDNPGSQILLVPYISGVYGSALRYGISTFLQEVKIGGFEFTQKTEAFTMQ